MKRGNTAEMQPEESLAVMIRNGARALAGYAASSADAGGGCDSPAQFAAWQNLLVARLDDLATALLTRQPDLFVQQIAWTRTALDARGVSSADFRSRLEALRQVLAEELPEDLAPLAVSHADRALAEFDAERAGLAPRLTAGTADERLAAEYLLAILEGDRRKASRLIQNAAEAGRSAADLYLRVLQPAQEELGRMWILGEINVAEEHFATTTTRLVMAQLHARQLCRPANGKTLVIAAVAGNHHDLGVQMVGDVLELAGWRVIQLGANVPKEDLAQAVDFYAADLVALGVSLASQLPELKETIASIRAGHNGAQVKIIVGGYKSANMTEVAASLGADGFAANAVEALVLGNALVGLPKSE